MARTIDEIYLSIISAKDNSLADLTPNNDTVNQLKEDLTTTSKVAKWRLWAYITAVAIWILETLWDLKKVELQAASDKTISGNKRWYHAQCLLYQHGYQLYYFDKKWQYEKIDTDAQIIKRVSIATIDRVVNIKVAQLINDVPAPLNTSMLDGFTAYINKMKFEGTKLNILSIDADRFIFSFKVYFDKSIDEDTIKSNISTATNNYLANIIYGGVYNITKHIDAIQAAIGVTDIYIEEAKAKGINDLNYNTITDNYEMKAGYGIICPDGELVPPRTEAIIYNLIPDVPN